MPARARREIVDSDSLGYYHCYSRCVRRAFLCGNDPYSGKNYDHRKDWVEQRLEVLACYMAVDVLATAADRGIDSASAADAIAEERIEAARAAGEAWNPLRNANH